MDIAPLKPCKRTPLALRMLFLLSSVVFGLYICSICLKQIGVHIKPKFVLPKIKVTGDQCILPEIPSEDLPYLHFPQPKTYSRGECECSPVRFFVIFSMQRSGSGWFETLLNSHPNISSNGEIFSVKDRRSNASSILATLDKVYRLEWISSAAKNECVAAVGLKWMLNQGVMEYHKEIIEYFKKQGVSVLFLFRRNLLRRLISVLANAYDREAKQLNGTHKSHVHSPAEAKVLAMYRPVLSTDSLVKNLKHVDNMMLDSLKFFNHTRHVVLYYEEIRNNQKKLAAVQKFLGVPVRKLESRQVKIHVRPSSQQVENWDDVYKTLKGTQYESFLEDADYNSE